MNKTWILSTFCMAPDRVPCFLDQEKHKKKAPNCMNADEFRYQYRSAAIIADQRKSQSGQLNGDPGTRAPHAWVAYQGRRVSTLDLFGTSFVLLAGSDGVAWCKAARLIADRRGLNLVAYSVGPQGDLLDPEKRWQTKAGISASGALLVRPDGFVAWRASAQNDNYEQQLERVLDQLLGASARVNV